MPAGVRSAAPAKRTSTMNDDISPRAFACNSGTEAELTAVSITAAQPDPFRERSAEPLIGLAVLLPDLCRCSSRLAASRQAAARTVPACAAPAAGIADGFHRLPTNGSRKLSTFLVDQLFRSKSAAQTAMCPTATPVLPRKLRKCGAPHSRVIMKRRRVGAHHDQDFSHLDHR